MSRLEIYLLVFAVIVVIVVGLIQAVGDRLFNHVDKYDRRDPTAPARPEDDEL